MTPWLQSSSIFLTLLVMFIGLFGLVIPVFPGGVVIWLGALGYGVLNGFSAAGIAIFVIITLLMIASGLADNVLMGAKARTEGASWLSLGIALVMGVMATFFFPPFGGLIAAPLALYTSEYIRYHDWEKAVRVTRGMMVGCGWAFFVRFGLGTLKIGLWAVWVWTDFS